MRSSSSILCDVFTVNILQRLFVDLSLVDEMSKNIVLKENRSDKVNSL